MKVGIIGLGSMGLNHLRVLQTINEVTEIYIYETDQKKEIKYPSFTKKIIFVKNIEDIFVVSAVIVSCPTEFHFQYASILIKNKIPILIEKPAGLNSSEIHKLLELSNNTKSYVAVGYVEYFNPAFQQFMNIVKNDDDKRILSLSMQRLSYDSKRIKNIDVVFDLMSHDIFLLTELTDSPFEKIVAFPIINTSYKVSENTFALIKARNNMIVNLQASRIVHDKIREIRAECVTGTFHVDLIQQEISFYKGGDFAALNTEKNIYRQDLIIEKIFVQKKEPLYLELNSFIQDILNHTKETPSLEKAFETMKIAERIIESYE